jgi:hypothetical protein
VSQPSLLFVSPTAAPLFIVEEKTDCMQPRLASRVSAEPGHVGSVQIWPGAAPSGPFRSGPPVFCFNQTFIHYFCRSVNRLLEVKSPKIPWLCKSSDSNFHENLVQMSIWCNWFHVIWITPLIMVFKLVKQPLFTLKIQIWSFATWNCLNPIFIDDLML